MGKLLYGSAGVAIEFDDRTLAHVQLVLGAKLRRHEALFFSWRDVKGGTRGSIWVSSTLPMYFTFDSDDRQPINRVWLEALIESSNSAQGLWLSQEPAQDAAAAGASSPTAGTEPSAPGSKAASPSRTRLSTSSRPVGAASRR